MAPEQLKGLIDPSTTISTFGAPTDIYHVALMIMHIKLGKCGIRYANQFLLSIYNGKADLHFTDLMILMLCPDQEKPITALAADVIS